MRIRKTAVGVLSVLVLAVLLTACGEGPGGTAVPVPTQAPAQAGESSGSPASPVPTAAAETPPVQSAAEASPAQPAAPETAAPSARPADTRGDTLTAGCSPFSGKFSPFFAETKGDADVCAMTQLSLLSRDRSGSVVQNGIEGEVIEYRGTPYTYYGPADLTVSENDDGTVNYDFVLRDDLVFSDGVPITADDVIFSLYVYCDPTYDGSSAVGSLPILGKDAYRAGMDTLLDLIYKAGRDNTDETYFTAGQQAEFWAKYDAAVLALAQEITDYCLENLTEYGVTDVASSASLWGYEDLPEDASVEDFAAALSKAYGPDVSGMIRSEYAASSVEELFPDLEEYSAAAVVTGESAPGISGIRKTGDHSLRLVLTQADDDALSALAFPIVPLHYYGDPALYDYENDSFGFPKGDLSLVRVRTSQPLGAGPYRFREYGGGSVSFEANGEYYLGAPRTRYLSLVQYATEPEMLGGILGGAVDVAEISLSAEEMAVILRANGNGSGEGPVISTETVENPYNDFLGRNSVIFSSQRVDMDTVTPDVTTCYGWTAEIQNLQMR